MNHKIALKHCRRPARFTSKVPSAGQRLIAIDAIVDVIFSFSTPRTIISLSQTCRAAHPIAASYFRVAYIPERFLQQFLPDPTDIRAFRSLQAETGVVVYGRAVRNFLARVPLADTEMGLSVDGSCAPRVNEFLTGAGYGVETREEELEFTKKGKDEQIVRKIVLRIGPTESFDTLDKARDFPIEFTDVLTFDGAYSLFPAQYDKPNVDPLVLSELPQSNPKPLYRSFSDRSSWVVSFDKTNVVQLAFGTSAPVRDPLYTSSSVLEWPSQKDGAKSRGAVIRLRGIVLRSPYLRLPHVMCCPKLSQFVQQFLARLVLAYPERASSYFDTEVAYFLRVVFEKADIRGGIASYATVWVIMKEMVQLPSDKPGGGLQWSRPTCTKEYHFISPV